LTEEQKAEIEEFKNIISKQKSGETLTTEEQAKLEELKATQP
jgi:uncharacterized FlgJ-related protein